MSQNHQNSQRKPGSTGGGGSNRGAGSPPGVASYPIPNPSQRSQPLPNPSQPPSNPSKPVPNPSLPPSNTPTSPPTQIKESPFEKTAVYEAVGRLDSGDNGSIEVIVQVLRLLAKEAGPLTHSSATLQTLFSALLGSYDQILEQINAVENANKDSKAAWIAFEKYTDAIPELERLLLDLSFLSKPESYGQLPPRPQPAVNGTTVYIADWERVRDAVLSVTKGLRSPVIRALGVNDGMVSSIEAAMQKDDLTMSRFLMHHVTSSETQHPFFKKKKHTYREDINTKVKALQDALETKPPADEGSRRLIIKGLLLVATPFAILNSSKEAEPAAVDQMQTDEVWDSAKKLLDGLVELVKSPKAKGDSAALKAGALYEALQEVLTKLAGTLDISPEFFDLLRKYRKMRRPYTARAREIIQIVYELDEHSKKAENRKTTDRNELRDAIESLSGFFNDLISGVTSVSKFPRDEKDEKVKATEGIYKDAVDTLWEVTDEFKLMSEEDFDERLDKATSVDDEIFGLFRDRVQV